MNVNAVIFKTLVPVLLLTAFALPSMAGVRKVTDPDAPRSLPVDGSVDVRWTDPAQFTDIRYSGNRHEAERGNWVNQLAEYMRERAEKRMPAGERLEVEITDIRRAGTYEPWRSPTMQDVRIMRDMYPPRMELRFQRLAADGSVIDEGERKLVDGAFLMRSQILSNTDPLRYEKTMIDRWVRDEFSTPIADAGN